MDNRTNPAVAPHTTVTVDHTSPAKKKPSIPTLLHFGTDLTRHAREGKLLPVVGRDDEIQLIIETLCRRTKRNPVLVGAAGVGKTAIVEGFAQRMVRGEVPCLLTDSTVVLLQPSLIVSGGGSYGELEKRMTAILAEASHECVILFIDEVHSIIGAGGAPGTADIASLMKTALARGDIACIAATTDEEYRKYIEPDTALERRFQPIRVQEMNTEQVLEVLREIRDDLNRTRGVAVSDDILNRLIGYAEKYLRNRTFPDKAVDLLEQCVAYAMANRLGSLSITDAESVVQRMIGIPLDLGARIAKLRQSLADRCLMTDSDIESLTTRLQVTMRGLDIRMVRPNAVLLFMGEAASHGEAIAETISKSLFETYSRVIKVDMARFSHPEDVTLLLGAPPGYVGYSDGTPLHSIKQQPWSVVLFENVDTAHPQVCHILVQGIRDGYFLDGQSRKVYLSDSVVVLTAKDKQRAFVRPIGFTSPDYDGEKVPNLADREMNASLEDALDLVCSEMGSDCPGSNGWLRKELLAGVAERFGRHGIQLRWDDSLLSWLESRSASRMTHAELEQLVDREISQVILAFVNEVGRTDKTIVVKILQNRIESQME